MALTRAKVVNKRGAETCHDHMVRNHTVQLYAINNLPCICSKQNIIIQILII